MKSFLLIAAIACTFAAAAQDCGGYYFLQNNKTVEMTIFDKKGKPTGKQVYNVSDVQKSGGTTTAHLNTEMFNEDNKSLGKSSATVECTGGAMMMDMKLSMPQSPNGNQPAATDVKIDKFFIEYPANMSVGDKLKDATMNADMQNNGIVQNMNMEVTNRQVLAKEKVTTAAGSWDCFKIGFHSKVKIKTMGIGVPMNMDGTEWFAPGFGIVKSESKYGRTEISSVK